MPVPHGIVRPAGRGRRRFNGCRCGITRRPFHPCHQSIRHAGRICRRPENEYESVSCHTTRGRIDSLGVIRPAGYDEISGLSKAIRPRSPRSQAGLRTRGDGLGQRRVGRLVRQVYARRRRSGGTAGARAVTWSRIVPRSIGIAGLERIEHRAERDRPSSSSVTSPVHSGQRSQMVGQFDANHERRLRLHRGRSRKAHAHGSSIPVYSTCASTDSTAGRSWTMAFQLIAAVGRAVDLAAGGAEVDAARDRACRPTSRRAAR